MTRRISAGACAVLIGLAVVASGPCAAQSSTNQSKGGASALSKPAPAAAQAAAPAAAPAALPPVPISDAAKTAWETSPLDDRVAIQTGLVWTGDYSGALDGTFGRMTWEAIRAYQSRHGFNADGIASPRMAAELARTAAERRDAVGFRMVDDAATGVRIGLPTRLLGKPAKAENGTLWRSADGRIEFRTSAVAGLDLASLFERTKAEAPGRKVGYAVLRADWFVVADTAGATQGYTRFERVGDGVRGFSVRYDVAVGPDFGRVVVATAGTFVADAAAGQGGTGPLAAGPAVDAGSASGGGSSSGAGSGANPGAATPSVGMAAPRPQIATAVVVGPDRAVTVAGAVVGCRSLSLAGRPASVAGFDDSRRLAFLTGAGAALPPLPLADAVAADAPVTLVAVAAEGTAVTPGVVVADGVRSALQPGGQGAPIVDAGGRLVGLAESAPEAQRRIAGVVPAATRPYVPAAALAGPLGPAATPAPAPAVRSTTAAVVADLVGRLARIDCVR